MATHWLPEGQPRVSPYLMIQGVSDLIPFLEKVFDAEVDEKVDGPGGRVMHAQLRIGDSVVMMGEAPDTDHVMPGFVHVYVQDADATYDKAIDAGATSIMEPSDQFYGDRAGGVKDASGNWWWIATHIEDLSPDEIQKRAAAQGKA